MAYDPTSDIIPDEEEIDLGSESKDQQAAGSKPELTAEELLFLVGEGAEQKKLAFKQLTPDVVKPWYEAHVNRQKWQAENTQNAQKFAKEREDFEKGKKEHQYSLDQLKLWEEYFSKNQELQGLVTAYLQGRISKETLGQLIGAQAQNQSAPLNPEIQKRLDTLEARLKTQDEKTQAERDARARQEAFALLKNQHPDLKEEDFQKFLDTETDKLDDLGALYALAHDAYRYRNSGDMKKKAEEEALRKLKEQRGAAIETGSTQSATSLPHNIDVTKSMDKLFDDFEETLKT